MQGTISNNYSFASVTAGTNSANVAGLVGNNSGTINTSYSVGAVTSGAGSTGVGGFVGANTGSVGANNYWDQTVSGQMTSAGGTGKSTNEMQQLATLLRLELHHDMGNLGWHISILSHLCSCAIPHHLWHLTGFVPAQWS